ncbi:MAG: hypothetical protein INR62_02355 [Rhodospirillales bacterium]|nr:hypothetical protein [Acetobacter sp.]
MSDLLGGLFAKLTSKIVNAAFCKSVLVCLTKAWLPLTAYGMPRRNLPFERAAAGTR